MAGRSADTEWKIPQALDGKAVSARLSGKRRRRSCGCIGGLQARLWLAALGRNTKRYSQSGSKPSQKCGGFCCSLTLVVKPVM